MRRVRTVAALLTVAAVAGALPMSAAATRGEHGLGASRPLPAYPVQVYFSRHPVSDAHYGPV